MWYFNSYNSIPSLAKAIHAEALGGYINGEKLTVAVLEHYLRTHLEEHIRMGCFPKLHTRHEFHDGKCGLQRDTLILEIARETGRCALVVERRETWCDAELLRKRGNGPRPLHYSNSVEYTFEISDDPGESERWWALLEG